MRALSHNLHSLSRYLVITDTRFCRRSHSYQGTLFTWSTFLPGSYSYLPNTFIYLEYIFYQGPFSPEIHSYQEHLFTRCKIFQNPQLIKYVPHTYKVYKFTKIVFRHGAPSAKPPYVPPSDTDEY